MPTFDAKSELEPLTYKFEPYSEARGEVPEPTDDQVAEFYAGLAKTLENTLDAERLEGIDMTLPADIGKLFASLSAEEHKLLYDTLLELHAAVCGGSPSRDDIAELPYRVRQAWYGAVQGWLRPEASRPATNS